MVDNWLYFKQLIKLGNCLSCGQPLPLFEDFCAGCAANLPVIQAHCPGCGRASNNAGRRNTPCGQCQKHPRCFSRVHVLFKYREPVSTYIHQLKYRNRLDLARSLGTLMAKHIESTYSGTNTDFNHNTSTRRPDTIMPIPLHPARLASRGFNQALELARPIAEHLHLPLDYLSLVRIRKTRPQMELSVDERKRNIRHAFAVRNQSLAGKRIALIDDVLTTGLTADTASRALLDAGAASVECWVLARAGLT